MVSTKATRVPSILASLDIAGLPADAQRSLAQRINGWANQYEIDLAPEKEKPVRKVAATVKPVRTQKEKPMPKLDPEAIIRRVVAEMLATVEVEPTPIRRAPTARKAKPKGNKFYREVIVPRAKRRAAEVEAGSKVVCEDERCYKHGHAFINDAAHWGQHKQMFAAWFQQIYGRKTTHR